MSESITVTTSEPTAREEARALREGAGLAQRLRRSRRSLNDHVYDVLRRAIVEGELTADTRMVEPDIADELGVSRTPVREALRRLEQGGLLVRRGRGLYVAGLDREKAAEITELRALLEGYAARLAASRISQTELAVARAAHEAARAALEAGDIRALTRENTTFHDTISGACNAARCIALIGELRDWVLRYRIEVLQSEDARRRSFEQHAEILDALEAQDGARAEELVRRHIADAGAALIEAIARHT